MQNALIQRKLHPALPGNPFQEPAEVAFERQATNLDHSDPDSEGSYEIVVQEGTSESELPDSPAVPGNPNAEAPIPPEDYRETSGKPWKHLRQTQDTSEALPWNAETRLGDVYNFTTKGQVEYQKEYLPPFEQFSDRSHRFRTQQRQFQIPLGRTMPDPRYGISPHYLYGTGTPAKYNAAMTAVPDYKEAPHLQEYQWDSRGKDTDFQMIWLPL